MVNSFNFGKCKSGPNSRLLLGRIRGAGKNRPVDESIPRFYCKPIHKGRQRVNRCTEKLADLSIDKSFG